jgi:hypothetical protein
MRGWTLPKDLKTVTSYRAPRTATYIKRIP